MRWLWWSALVVQTHSMRVMTWNVWNERVSGEFAWEDRRSVVRATVERSEPTVFAVQECTKSMYDTMVEWMPYATQFEASDEGTGEGLVMFSRMPIQREWRESLPDGKNDRNHRKVLWVEIDDKLFGNVHLSYDADDASHQLSDLLERAAPRVDVLMGDFNVYADGLDAFNNLVESSGWISTFDGPTWSAIHRLQNPADRVLVRDTQVLDFHSRSFRVVGEDGVASDHRAVIVDIDFSQNSDLIR